MAKEKFGPWHPGTLDQKPVHVGLYQTRYPDGTGSAGDGYWDGNCWRYSASKMSGRRIWQNLQWRGLAEKPE